MKKNGDLVDHAPVTVDLQAGTIRVEGQAPLPFTDPVAFQLMADLWLRAGWDAKYVYGFTWLGRPVIQQPDDLMTLQEVIHAVQPDVLVEIGVAHGGSLVFYASLFRLLGKGRVVGVDIEIRPHNRTAIEGHPLFPLITLIEGDSIAPATLDAVRRQISPGDKVMVLLDGLHTRAQVLAELRAYGPLVSPGSYIVAMDGIMARVAGAVRSGAAWREDNPQAAVGEFLATDDRFELAPPLPPFNEGSPGLRPTYSPNGWLRRKASHHPVGD
jgi:cephalosporin hydroxylase